MKKNSIISFSLLLCTILISTVWGQNKKDMNTLENTTSRNNYRMIAQYAEKVTMDGKLSDPAWGMAKAYPFELYEKCYDSLPVTLRNVLGNELHEGGSVKLLWNDEYLYVGVAMEDSDVIAEDKEDQTHLYAMGDVVEVFLKPANETYYWEIYGAPNNKKTCFFYPGRGRLFLPSVADYRPAAAIMVTASVDGKLNNWHERDLGWSVIIAIPVKELTAYGTKFDNSANWTILVARYNYSRYLPMKECSSVPRLSSPNNHIYEEYAKLIFEK